MKDARAKRKIVVIGQISDFVGKNSQHYYVSVARQALAVANHVAFVGSHAFKSLKAKRHPQDDSLQAFNSLEAASESLNALFQPGDLVLLKGGWRDRLRDIILARTSRADESLPSTPVRVLSEPHQSRSTAQSGVSGSLAHPPPPVAAHPVQAVVGLGNAGEQYRDTPHNVGQHVVDLLASSLRGEWRQIEQAMVAVVEYQRNPVHLVKPLTKVNYTGPALLQLAPLLAFGPAECILVHDDMSLPLGTVRMRVRRSSDGGHKGVRSILQAFRTDEVRRVKIGVGQEHVDQMVDYVLTTFSPAALSTIEKACGKAANRVLEMVASWRADAH